MQDLLKYIIEMPTEEDSHNRAHKFPFLVSDILASSENSSLLDVFYREPEEEEEIVEEPPTESAKDVKHADEMTEATEDTAASESAPA